MRTVERLTTPRGELVLREDEGDYEIILGGVFLMDTRDGRSERLMVREALAASRHRRSVAILGLGVGFSLAEAVADQALERIVVVEREPTVVGWQREHLGDRLGRPLADPRVELVCAPAADWLRDETRPVDAVCVDIDNGPDWLVSPDNAAMYTTAGLDAVTASLRPGGALAVWSAHEVPSFHDLLASRFREVVVHRVSVRRGPPDVIYVAHPARTVET